MNLKPPKMLGHFNMAEAIKNKALHMGRPHISKSKKKLFKLPVRIPRGM